MTVLQVPDIHCQHCVSRINDALRASDLVFEVSEETRTVSIEGGQKAVSRAIERLDDLGYDAVVLKNSK